MKERPILFNAPMVRALLAGTKTQTRRVVKMKPHHQIEERDDGTPWPWMYDGERNADSWLACPYGQPGDRLWVRETFGHFERNKNFAPGCDVFYRADGESLAVKPWRPSIHMPRWASRITLEVTGVRVERLQDISSDDARAEGCPDKPIDDAEQASIDLLAKLWYHDLWEQINGLDSWAANPWVWVVEFKRVKGDAA